MCTLPQVECLIGFVLIASLARTGLHLWIAFFRKQQDDMNLGDMVVSVPYVFRCMEEDAAEASEVGSQEWALDRQDTRGVSGAMMGYLGQRPTTAAATTGVAARAAAATGTVKAAEAIIVDGDNGLTLAASMAAPISEAAAPSLEGSRSDFSVTLPLNTATAEALQARVSLLLAHGLLHLLGHDHEHSVPPGDEDGKDEEDYHGEKVETLSAAEEARVEAMYEIMVAEEERLVAGMRDLLPPEG